MQRLWRIGISFVLADFGTGCSSLAYLKWLPLDTLKIGIAFVRDLTLDTPPIAGTIIAHAKSLGLNVIAEGVETVDQRLALYDLGCKIYQGFLFGRPGPVEDFIKSLPVEEY
jgi:diguanylate cyclase|tara:strand:- start:217 stop:552 length:336 start_codon:yes stop_codon:yes gene_type:complete